jgi:peptidoglycan/LPS O-acetylase OafA/YrhL
MRESLAPAEPKGGRYLSEIDGLRCLAIGGVLLFHLDLAEVRGGYLGVDVFFVISGYLIIGAVSKAIAAGTFSLGDFYGRRFRRIYPALVCTIAFTQTSDN